MSSPRFQIPREAGSLKDAAAALVKACGGLEKAAALTRVSPSQMQRYTAPSDAETHMPIDVVIALEMHCGHQHVTSFAAFQTGALLVQLPQGSPEPYLKHLCEIGKKTGDLFAEAHQALADGVMTPREAGKVMREGMRLATAIALLLGRLRAVMTSGKADR